MKRLGESLRELRKAQSLLIREVASGLGIDPSLLSRIERSQKQPTRQQVVQLSGILKGDQDELLADYLSERILSRLKDEEPLALKAIAIAEQKMKWLSMRNY